MVLGLLLAEGANAATWSVSSTTDTPVGQACPGFTNCSLREAITSTEANPGSDAILVSAGTYPLTNGQLTVTQDLTVSRVGAGAATVSGSNSSRIFNISGSGTVTRTAPTLIQAPSVKRASSPTVGVALAAYRGQWTGAPDSYSYQWIRCDADGTSNCSDISGRTRYTYTPVSDDVGHTLRVRVVASNTAGDGAPATSAPTGVVS